MENNGIKIILIDDEPQLLRTLSIQLNAHGFHTITASRGEEGIESIVMHKPDLVLLDLSLPDEDGLEVIAKLRQWSNVPIIVLSAKDQEQDKIAALHGGADDYVSKPFGIGELIVRIEVALRHSVKTPNEPVLNFEDITLDIPHRVLMVNETEVKLTPIEYGLLLTMATHAGKVLTHRQLLQAVWGSDYEKETPYLRVYMAHLRNKIGDDPIHPRHIITEPGVGYRFV